MQHFQQIFEGESCKILFQLLNQPPTKSTTTNLKDHSRSNINLADQYQFKNKEVNILERHISILSIHDAD